MKRSYFLLALIFFCSFGQLFGQDMPDTLPTDTTQNIKIDSLQNKSETSSEDNAFVYPLTAERKELLISYSKFKNIWQFVSFFVNLLIILILLYTGLSGKFQKWATSISPKTFFKYLLYLLFFSIFTFVVYWPFDFYRSFLVEHQYGFSNQTFSGWLFESLKSEAVSFVFLFIVILILYWLINRFKHWWLWFAIGSLPFMVIVVIIVPVVVSPMFNEFQPLKDQALKTEMIQLAESAGIHNPDVFEVDASKQTKKLNAYFTGMLGTRRIVLYDNIINAMTVDELKFVMGHEIGHYKMNHIWKGLLIAVVFIFFAVWLINRFLHRTINRNSRRFGFSKLGEIASLPLIFLFISIFSFFTQPIQNYISRSFEYDADEYGMSLSGVDVETATIAFDKLSVYNLSDPDPPAIIEFWFYSHPSIKKRVRHINDVYNRINHIN